MSYDLIVLDNVQKFTRDFETIKIDLKKSIEKYSKAVVNEENLQDMEKEQREIASLRVKLTKFKTFAKKEIMKPYEIIEMQANDLLKLVDDVEAPINEQLLKYEQKRREKKAIEVQHWINEISVELGLDEKYAKQIAVADKYLNRTQKPKETKEDIQMKVCWFLDVQAKEREAETFRQEKIEMAKFLCQSLSVGLVTPVTFEEIEYKIDSTDIASLKTYIENEVARRKERETKAAQAAVEKIEQSKTTKIEIITEQLKPLEENKKYNSKFVVYGLTLDEHIIVEQFLRSNKLDFQSAMKEIEKEA